MSGIPQSRLGRRKRSKAMLALWCILGLGALGAVGYGLVEGGGLLRTSQSITVDIPQGASTAGVAASLHSAKAIGNPLLFRIYSRLTGADGSYQYGSFRLSGGLSYPQIQKTLQQPTQYQPTIRLTFPEGYNAYQYAAVVEKAGLCTQGEFLDALATRDLPFDFAKEIGDNPLKMVRLEGFLFPDTYEFFESDGVEAIIHKLLENFETKVWSRYREEIAASGYSLEELITFASIIQKESASVAEMYNVSSVFHNRLANPATYPCLESCTTNNYITDYIRPRYQGKDLEQVVAAYDTYSKAGFPVGAIANPGLDAIDATLFPQKNTLQGTYYFFVTDVEYTHYYGKTFQEHLANIEKAKTVNRRYGIEGLVS